MHDPAELERALEQVTAPGSAEVYEDGALLADLFGFRYELRQQGKQAMLHLWSEERNLVRRILRVAETQSDRILLEVQRFGQTKPGKLEIVRSATARPIGRLQREKFRVRFAQLLAEQFPDESVESLTTAPDLEHSFSGSYARGLMHRGSQAWAVLAVSPGEDSGTIDSALAFGLLWLDWTRERAQRRVVQGLRLFLPASALAVTVHRLRALGPAPRVEIYEWQLAEGRVRRVDLDNIGNVTTRLTPRREVDDTLLAAREMGTRICALNPQAIDAVVPPGTREVAWRFRGLEFARWENGRVTFGLPEERRELTSHSWDSLVQLVKQLDAYRHPSASDVNHPLYRAASERWLETLVLADPTRIDAHLDPQHIYSQVPAFSAGDRGVIDLLAVTRDGRLAVLELKVTEDLHLPLQAVDYWLRVRWHHRGGDFSRCGYFAGKQLHAAAPLLYLIAPGLRFHPASEVLLRYLSPEITVCRVGLNEHWRRGLRVMFRQ